MDMKKSLVVPILAALLALPFAADAARRPGGGGTSCPQLALAYAAPEPGKVDLHASFANLCYPAKDIEGKAELLLDGVVIGSVMLDAADKARIDLLVPVAPGFHAVTLRVIGSMAGIVKNKLVVEPFAAEKSWVIAL